MLYRFYPPLRRGIALVCLLAFGFLVAGCAGSQEGAQKGSASPVAGSFVGEISQIDSFVALVASEPQDGSAQEIKAYVCDGSPVTYWFRGSVSGADLDLSSDNGARLKGQLTPNGATGTFISPNGDAVPFETYPATGIAGLYNVTISSDMQQLSGTSERGGRLEGQLSDKQQDGGYLLTGTITAPDGEAQDIETTLGPSKSSGEDRWVVLPDGRFKGVEMLGLPKKPTQVQQ